MVIKVKGKLIFQPENKTKKHEKQDWKRVAMIMLNCDIDNYYAWFLTKRFGLEFVKNLRGAHITIISDRIKPELFEEASKLFNNKEMTFYYELEPRTNTKHWWLRVHCPEAEIIRESMGLTKEPYFGFHLTIGYMGKARGGDEKKNIKHSEYVLNNIKRFNLLSNSPRQPLSTHEIIEPTETNTKREYTSDRFIYNSKTIHYTNYSFGDNGSYTEIENHDPEMDKRSFYKKL